MNPDTVEFLYKPLWKFTQNFIQDLSGLNSCIFGYIINIIRHWLKDKSFIFLLNILGIPGAVSWSGTTWKHGSNKKVQFLLWLLLPPPTKLTVVFGSWKLKLISLHLPCYFSIYTKLRAVFIWVLKVIIKLLWFWFYYSLRWSGYQLSVESNYTITLVLVLYLAEYYNW